MISRYKRVLIVKICLLLNVACICFYEKNIYASTAITNNIYANTIQWIEDNGNKVQLNKWRGKNTIITMAYSACRKMCVETLHKLEEIQGAADKNNQEIEIIVVSFDPDEDNAESWDKYRKKRKLERKNWHFLTGNKNDTRALANQLGIGFWLMDDGHVMHDFKILKITPEGAIDKYIDWDHRKISTFLDD